jgi:hypothetical protein
MSCESILPDVVYECDFCECQFEPDVADAGPDGQPRCPQCGMYTAHRVAPDEIAEFVVTRGTRFR